MAVRDDSTEANRAAWLGDTHQAWVRRFGTVEDVVGRLRKNPTVVLQPTFPFFGKVAGKRIMNLMGSSGTKGLALAMLGAEVTIVDWSPGSAQYARELAAAAGLDLRYVVADVLEMPPAIESASFDFVFAELGIVHYFTDLCPLMETVRRLLVPGGRFILRDFHPVSTKLIASRGAKAGTRKHKVDGDYFDASLEARPVPWAKHLEGQIEAAPRVYWRRWTLGEVVTAVASVGLYIRVLREEPNLSSESFDRGIPKTFTLVADRVADTGGGTPPTRPA